MIDKICEFGFDEDNPNVNFFKPSRDLEKVASYGYAPEIQTYIDNLPDKKSELYALINALSAGEYFSANLNGDYFPERMLQDSHKTFETHGHLYYHHVNKNPEKAAGKVLFSHYNPKMHRVEIIVKIFTDKPEAQKLLQKLHAGEKPHTSMGVRVPYDTCSICGNKARTRSSYCDHLSNEMGKVYPDGRKVYAINPPGKFFDISIVTIPADLTSRVITLFNDILPEFLQSKLANFEKTANMQIPMDIASQPIPAPVVPKISKLKSASINKQLPIDMVDIGDSNTLVKAVENKLPAPVITKLAEFPLSNVLGTMLGLRIIPTPEDFQKIALYCTNRKDLADELESRNVVFSLEQRTDHELDLDYDLFDEKIAELFLPDISQYTWTKQFVASRGLQKLAEQPYVNQTEPSTLRKFFFDYEPEPPLKATQNPIIPLGILGGLYYAYAKTFNDVNTNSFRTFVSKNPWLVPLLIGGAAYGAIKMQENSFEKQAGTLERLFLSSLVAFPASYYFAGKAQNKVYKNEPITQTENFVRKHPILVGALGTLVGAKAGKEIGKALDKVGNFMYNVNITNLNSILEDLK